MRIHAGKNLYAQYKKFQIRNEMSTRCGSQLTEAVTSANKDTVVLTYNDSDSERDDRPYKCEICGHKFFSSQVLTQHLKIHTGEKPYECKVCGRKFIRSGSLKVHMRCLHTGERPYACQICRQHFTKLEYLKHHNLKVHGNKKLYQCKEKGCGEKFTYYTELRNHKLIHQHLRDGGDILIERDTFAKDRKMHTAEEPSRSCKGSVTSDQLSLESGQPVSEAVKVSFLNQNALGNKRDLVVEAHDSDSDSLGAESVDIFCATDENSLWTDDDDNDDDDDDDDDDDNSLGADSDNDDNTLGADSDNDDNSFGADNNENSLDIHNDHDSLGTEYNDSSLGIHNEHHSFAVGNESSLGIRNDHDFLGVNNDENSLGADSDNKSLGVDAGDSF